MEDDDDFTFPTVAAAPVPDGPPVARLLLHQLPLPDPAATASPLWPFAGSPKATSAADGDGRRADEAGGVREERGSGAAADEERMDLLWEGNTTATTPVPQSTVSGAGHADESQPTVPTPAPRRAGADGDDKRRAAAAADAERMDKLWESFNEELLLLRRGRAKPAADRNTDWYLRRYPPPPDDDAEDSEGTSASLPAERRAGYYGCAPAVLLRASSRAGGAGPFCGGSGRRRGAAGGWALLLGLFRRLFAVDRAAAASRAHATIYVP